MPTFSRVRRKRGPALNWAPTDDTYYELAQLLHSEARTPLYLTQPAILECEAHLRETSSPLPFGLLAGEICVCRETELEYLLVDTVCPARTELSEDDPYAQLAEELKSLAAEQAAQSKLAIGWYLGGLADDLTLDNDVTVVHRALFPERWQVALLRGNADVDRGAFLRFEDLWSRWYSIPFFESLPEHAGHEKGERGTAIRWANYSASAPTRPLEKFEAAERRAYVPPRSWWETSGLGASLEPFRRAMRGIAVRAPERTLVATAPSPKETTTRSATTVAPATTARPAVAIPASRARPLDAVPSPRRAPDPPRIAPAEPKVAVHTEPVVAAPPVQEPTARAKPATHVEQELDLPVARMATTTEEPKVAFTAAPSHSTATEPGVESGEEAAVRAVAPPVEMKVAQPAELKAASPVEQEVAPTARTNAARETHSTEVQHIFIDGVLVQAPLVHELPERPGRLLRPDGVRILPLIVGAVFVLAVVVLYLIAR